MSAAGRRSVRPETGTPVAERPIFRTGDFPSAVQVPVRLTGFDTADRDIALGQLSGMLFQILGEGGIDSQRVFSRSAGGRGLQFFRFDFGGCLEGLAVGAGSAVRGDYGHQFPRKPGLIGRALPSSATVPPPGSFADRENGKADPGAKFFT